MKKIMSVVFCMGLLISMIGCGSPEKCEEVLVVCTAIADNRLKYGRPGCFAKPNPEKCLTRMEDRHRRDLEKCEKIYNDCMEPYE